MPLTSFPDSLDNLNIPHYERIRLDIQKRLVSQGWSPDQPIETEQVLAERYQVSVGTIRKAIERLVQDGLLFKAQGKGTFIKRPDFKSSLLRFFRYRDSSGQQLVPCSLIKSVSSVPADKQVNEKLLLPEDAPLINIKRLRIVDAKVVLSESIWLPQAQFSPLLQVDIAQFPNLLYPFYYEACHQFVLSATESLTFSNDYSEPAFNVPSNSLLVKIERVAYNIEIKPIEYRVTYGLPENFRYEVRIS